MCLALGAHECLYPHVLKGLWHWAANKNHHEERRKKKETERCKLWKKKIFIYLVLLQYFLPTFELSFYFCTGPHKLCSVPNICVLSTYLCYNFKDNQPKITTDLVVIPLKRCACEQGKDMGSVRKTEWGIGEIWSCHQMIWWPLTMRSE